jgi:hypothetical protein
MNPQPVIGVGFPGITLLEGWAYQVLAAFGEVPYLVGTAARGKAWRDVDIRLILDEERYVALFGPIMRPYYHNPRWSVICTALSVWGREQTGLPIDFQIQERGDAESLFAGRERVPLIVYTKRSEP